MRNEPNFSAIKPFDREQWRQNIIAGRKDTRAKRKARADALLTASGYHPGEMTQHQRKLTLAAIDSKAKDERRIKSAGVKRLHASRRTRAMPPWADPGAIEAVYREAKRLTAETGIPHEVDHILPLLGKTVSGLHVETNLRAVPRKVNRQKSNRI